VSIQGNVPASAALRLLLAFCAKNYDEDSHCQDQSDEE
jgi:hypothetical protein